MKICKNPQNMPKAKIHKILVKYHKFRLAFGAAIEAF